MKIKTLLLLNSLFILQGCANTPATQFYSLESIATSSNVATITQKPFVGVAQISLPSALEHKQIVTRDLQGQLHLAEQHQWAALLRQNITEVLAKNLAITQPNFWFKAHPWSLLGRVEYRLVIDVTRLEIVLGKSIVFAVDWTLLDEKNHAILKHDSLNLTQALNDENYSTAVASLNELLLQLSKKLVITGIVEVN